METREGAVKIETEWRAYKLSKIKKAESLRTLLNKKQPREIKMRKDLIKTAEYLSDKILDPQAKVFLDEIKQWLKETKSKMEVAIFHELETGSNWLATSENFQRLAQDDERLIRDNQYSKHTIAFIYGNLHNSLRRVSLLANFYLLFFLNILQKINKKMLKNLLNYLKNQQKIF